jgi:hypothetical protein
MTFAVRRPADPTLVIPPGAPFAPITHSYTAPGSYTEAVPAGASQLILELAGPGGGGGVGGGGSGALCRRTFPLSPADWSSVFAVTLDQGGAGVAGGSGQVSTPTIVTGMGVNLVAGGGGGGGADGAGGPGGVGSAGGGDVFAGEAGTSAAGGAAVRGNIITAGAGGGPGLAGQAGAVAFAYS